MADMRNADAIASTTSNGRWRGAKAGIGQENWEWTDTMNHTAPDFRNIPPARIQLDIYDDGLLDFPSSGLSLSLLARFLALSRPWFNNAIIVKPDVNRSYFIPSLGGTNAKDP
jgi:hypothetical protein